MNGAPDRKPAPLRSRFACARGAALALLLLALPGTARASDLMGPESCRACHAEAYKIWAQGPHARAAQALDDKQRRSPLCLYCHSRDEARSGKRWSPASPARPATAAAASTSRRS